MIIHICSVDFLELLKPHNKAVVDKKETEIYSMMDYKNEKNQKVEKVS